MQSIEQVGIVIKQIGGLASLVATKIIPTGVQFQYLDYEFTVTRVETSVVNNVRMAMMIAECDKTGKFMFIIHKEYIRTGEANEFA